MPQAGSMTLNWLYLDLNSFFASCEQQLQPELRGRPVAVVPLMSEGTCAIAASYEAKAYGIKTGTNVREARNRCPGIVFIPARPKAYVEFHHRVLDVIDHYIPVDTVRSIDELSCRLTGREQQPENAQKLACAIKQGIRDRVGQCLTSSVGLAPNVFLAKVASNMQKPDGLTTIRLEDLPHALHRLKLSDLHGIGRNMERRLWRHGIFDVQTLCELPPMRMRAIWGGVGGLQYYRQLRGDDWVPPTTTPRVIGHQHVLEPQLRTSEAGLAVCTRLLTKGAERMRSRQFYCRSLSVQVKFTEHRGYFERDIRFHETQDTAFLLRQLRELWQFYPHPQNWRPLRVGISLSGLVEESFHQQDLFNDTPPQKSSARAPRAELLSAVDALNRKYGRGTVSFGTDPHLKTVSQNDKIAFQRVPSRYEVRTSGL